MLKDELLTEASNLDIAVELDSIFESVELSDEVKANFATVFEQSVKTSAVKLAESRINAIAEKSDSLVEEKVTARTVEIENKLYEDTNTYFDHIAEEWLKENKEAVSKSIKSDLFESLVVGMKELFIDHNILIPEEQVDVVAELETELNENVEEVSRLLNTNKEKDKVINEMKRARSLEVNTKELTESQLEKVNSLIEGLEYSDAFDTKLVAIVEMVSAVKPETKVENINENKQTQDNFNQPEKQPTGSENLMSKYTQAAIRLQ